MRDKQLVVDDVPDPRPGPGQVLARTAACGICGSDLHALRHGEEMVDLSTESAGHDDAMPPLQIMDLGADVVMGHEYAAEIVELGPDTANCQVGDIVVSMPVVLDPTGLHPVGYSNQYPGGYGELMVLTDMMCLKVPDGLGTDQAALTEPMAVGLHAVNRSSITERDAAVVLGCGPVGLAVIGALRAMGVEPIVASDFSPRRRQLAQHFGAHLVVDAADGDPVETWREADGRRGLHIYEAVGVPGMIDRAMASAPRNAQIMVVGVCMERDHVRPMIGVAKELCIRFSFGYDPVEFASTLGRIAEGDLDVRPAITGHVDLDGVPQAFDDLAAPDLHAKILVRP
jgi:threonine dehydrogenase-like Zn-dependent dehydrogenase